MVFCNEKNKFGMLTHKKGHNPYFNRWFSAIAINCISLGGLICHNPYFNRWFSAIM